jgi:hypothetical protein
MSQIQNGQPRFDQLPYYREYLEHVLKPHVLELVDQLRSGLLDRVWADLVERMAEEQRQGGSADPEMVLQIRSLLQETLKLRLGTQVAADFEGGIGSTPVQVAVPEVVTRTASLSAEGRDNVEVVDRGFPNNPLARAVGGIKRATR